LLKKFFTAIDESNFHHLFRLNVKEDLLLSSLLNWTSDLELRNILIGLFHIKHYVTNECCAVLFQISRSTYHDIKNFITYAISVLDSTICLNNNRKVNNAVDEFDNTFMIVDCTECETNGQIKLNGLFYVIDTEARMNYMLKLLILPKLI